MRRSREFESIRKRTELEGIRNDAIELEWMRWEDDWNKQKSNNKVRTIKI